jgi:hypothetical protein
VTRYYFYLLKAAHAAVMTEVILTGSGPDDASQVQYGKERVQTRFKETSVMFGIDRLLEGTVRSFNRSFARLMNLLPIPGADSLKQFVRRVSRFATTYIDEAILTRAYRDDDANVWAVARDGVILYAQCWKPILANAVALTLLSYFEFLLFLVILGLPALLIGVALPSLKIALGIGVIVGAWMLKLAVADAFSLAATLLAYHRSTEGMTPDPTWQARLEEVSDQFRELKRKASEHMSGAEKAGEEASTTTPPPRNDADVSQQPNG